MFLSKPKQDYLMKYLEWKNAAEMKTWRLYNVCVQGTFVPRQQTIVIAKSFSQSFSVSVRVNIECSRVTIVSSRGVTNLVYFLWSIFIDSDHSISCTHIRCRHSGNHSQSHGDELRASFSSGLQFTFLLSVFSYLLPNYFCADRLSTLHTVPQRRHQRLMT